MLLTLKPGFIVKIFERYYRIKAAEPFRYDTGDESSAFFSSVSSGSDSGFKNITELEPDDLPIPHLFWVVPGFEDGMQYSIKIPTGTNRFGTDVTKGIGYLDNLMSPYYAPNEDYGFWLVNNYYPAINAKNVMSVAMTPKVHFRGIKFDLEPTTNPMNGSPVQEVIIGGLEI